MCGRVVLYPYSRLIPGYRIGLPHTRRDRVDILLSTHCHHDSSVPASQDGKARKAMKQFQLYQSVFDRADKDVRGAYKEAPIVAARLRDALYPGT
jgi:hypothetical protein